MKKNTVKKFLAVATAAAMMTALAACGSSSSGSTGDASESGNSSTAAASTAAGSTETAAASGKTYKVGVIQYMDHASLNQINDSMDKELDALSKEKGVTFDYKDYYENGQGDATNLSQMASDLIADDVDIIVAIATPAAQIAQSQTEGQDIPIVFSAVTDPVGAGLVESNDKPGANITGTSDALNTETMMNLILAQNPETDYVGLLYSNSEDSSEKAIKEAKEFLDGKGIKYIEKTGTTTDEVSQAADALIAEGVDAVFTPTDNTIQNAELSLYEKFTEAKIPQYCGADSFALNGAFCGFGINYEDLGKATADMVSDILVDGADPATTPVQSFDNGVATINTETCEALGYNLDDVEKAFEPYCSSIVETITAQSFD